MGPIALAGKPCDETRLRFNFDWVPFKVAWHVAKGCPLANPHAKNVPIGSVRHGIDRHSTPRGVKRLQKEFRCVSWSHVALWLDTKLRAN